MGDYWTPAIDAALTGHVKQGVLSYRLIAEAINDQFHTHYNRNCAIGRAKRLGLCNAPVKKAPLVSVNCDHQTAKAPPRQRYRPPPVPPAAPHVAPRHVLLTDLEPPDCRWPYGDGPYTFCGCPRAHKDVSYCPGHLFMAHRGGE